MMAHGSQTPLIDFWDSCLHACRCHIQRGSTYRQNAYPHWSKLWTTKLIQCSPKASAPVKDGGCLRCSGRRKEGYTPATRRNTTKRNETRCEASHEWRLFEGVPRPLSHLLLLQQELKTCSVAQTSHGRLVAYFRCLRPGATDCTSLFRTWPGECVLIK